jgi:DNA-binding PucR family transcriptional regulator
LAAGGIEVASAGSSTATDAHELEAAMERADFAAALSALLGKGAEPLQWQDTGSWRLLKGKALNEATVSELSEDAVELLKTGTPEQWQTLLAYFDAGRSVAATSQALSIHRATLHYRLERIREIIDPEALNDGWRAVSLHVALKLHQALQTSAATSR